MVNVTSKHLEDGKTIYYTFTDGSKPVNTCNVTLLITVKEAVDLFFYLTSISTMISWFSCILIFIVFIKLVKYNSMTIFLLLWLTFVDFLTLSGSMVQILQFKFQNSSVKNGTWTKALYNNTKEHLGCNIQSAFTSFALMWSFSLTIIFAFHLYQLQFSVNRRFMIPKGKGKYIRVFSTAIIPAIIVMCGLIKNKFGWSVFLFGRQWCWVIDNENPPEYALWIVLGGRGIELIAYIATITIYILSKYMLKTRSKMVFEERQRILDSDSENKPIHDLPGRYSILLWIFLYLYVTRSTGLLRYIIILLNSEHLMGNTWCNYMKVDSNSLVFIALFLNNLQSVVNFLIFCVFDRNTRISALQKLQELRSNVANNYQVNIFRDAKNVHSQHLETDM